MPEIKHATDETDDEWITDQLFPLREWDWYGLEETH